VCLGDGDFVVFEGIMDLSLCIFRKSTCVCHDGEMSGCPLFPDRVKTVVVLTCRHHAGIISKRRPQAQGFLCFTWKEVQVGIVSAMF